MTRLMSVGGPVVLSDLAEELHVSPKTPSIGLKDPYSKGKLEGVSALGRFT